MGRTKDSHTIWQRLDGPHQAVGTHTQGGLPLEDVLRVPPTAGKSA
jgi:hypothetical protein